MKLLLTVVMFLGCVSPLFGQINFSAIPFATQNVHLKSMSLGNATVSMKGELANEHINPAGIGINKILEVELTNKFFFYKWHFSSLTGNYKSNNSAFSVSVRHLKNGDFHSMGYPQLIHHRINSREIYINTAYSYSLGKLLNLGVGMNYIHVDEGISLANFHTKVEAIKSWSIDTGIQYQTHPLHLSKVKIQPSTGVSLTDFGPPVNSLSTIIKDPLPITLRAGIGLVITSNRKLLNQELFGITILQSASKILARKELVNSNSSTTYRAMPPFKALINAWGSFEFFDSIDIKKVNSSQQIWFQTGIEFKMLETVSLRGGFEKAAYNVERLTNLTIGLGIDLFYVDLNYGYVHFLDNIHVSADPYDSYLGGHHWQITGRIPLNGQRPDTILKYLFN